MADKKISQLTAATTPLAGTETLPIVQSGATVKVTVDNLTAGKTVQFTNAVLPYDASSEVVFKFNASYKFGISNRNGDARTLRLFAKAADNDGDVVIAAGNDVEHVRVKGTGDVQIKTGNIVMSVAGKGIVLTSPNGLVTKTLTIDNAGNIALI